ncbi:hypothetical protein GOP47_0023786 [Adiantum capillus-veneris]|uniref:Uncharacterized protein n=1 Tax=Adiantum capillus-veneris TaxID=13818 RepID=A0A9D4U459_ADICA|nr:hypothetical protein GOP47_0023786 [Adiantum capillus-veneris]
MPRPQCYSYTPRISSREEMMQRSHSLHMRGGEGDQGAASPAASPAAGATMWVPNSSQAPVQRSISVLVQEHHHVNMNGAAAGDVDIEAKDVEHDNGSGKARLKAEQSIHLIPLVLFLCALILWLSTPSTGKPTM